MTQDLLCYFVSFMGEKGLGHSTIKSYLAVVRSFQIDYGFQNPFGASMPKLERIMKGIKVSQGKEGQATRRKLFVLCELNGTPRASNTKKLSGNGMFLWIHESRGADNAGQG